jgi:RNA polymerase II subunit A small phosphatase-like protein
MSTKKHKKNLLLDLDQTVISGEASEEIDFNKYKEKSKLFRSDDMDGYYMIYSRPYLQEFLDYAFANFNVTVWTAATKDYALFICEKIIINNRPERKLDFIFFSYHCDLSKKFKKYSKELCMLWDIHKLPGYSEKNTVIIDDYKADVHKSQPNNCIIAPPFEFTKEGSENDTFLKDIIPEIEKMKIRMDKEDHDIATGVNETFGTFKRKN